MAMRREKNSPERIFKVQQFTLQAQNFYDWISNKGKLHYSVFER